MVDEQALSTCHGIVNIHGFDEGCLMADYLLEIIVQTLEVWKSSAEMLEGTNYSQSITAGTVDKMLYHTQGNILV